MGINWNFYQRFFCVESDFVDFLAARAATNSFGYFFTSIQLNVIQRSSIAIEMKPILTFAFLLALYPDTLSFVTAGRKYRNCEIIERNDQVIPDTNTLIMASGAFESGNIPDYHEFVSNFRIYTRTGKMYDLLMVTEDNSYGPRIYALPTPINDVDRTILEYANNARAAYVFNRNYFVVIDNNGQWFHAKLFLTRQDSPPSTIGSTAKAEQVFIMPELDQVMIYIKNHSESVPGKYISCKVRTNMKCEKKDDAGRNIRYRATKKPFFMLRNDSPRYYLLIYDDATFSVFGNYTSILTNSYTDILHNGTILLAKARCLAPTATGKGETEKTSVWAWISVLLVMIIIFVIGFSCTQYYK